VSACLLGAPVRYNGAAKTVESAILDRWQVEGRIVPVCPEVSGGLETPRLPAETTGGDGHAVLLGAARVLTSLGGDVTEAFVAGAGLAVALAREHRIEIAVLKSNSPSCGSGSIYDGTFSGTKVPGFGVTAAALTRAGVRVFDETQLADADAALVAIDAGRGA
jgi:uncharacterized protein YbbK (DUF523 family)